VILILGAYRLYDKMLADDLVCPGFYFDFSILAEMLFYKLF